MIRFILYVLSCALAFSMTTPSFAADMPGGVTASLPMLLPTSRGTAFMSVSMLDMAGASPIGEQFDNRVEQPSRRNVRWNAGLQRAIWKLRFRS